MNGPILQVKQLVKNFGGLKAVNEVNFEIGRDEIVGLIGPNGAGKSTLIRLMIGILSPTAGSVIFKEREVTGQSVHKRVNSGLACTFQIVKPFRNMPVISNVMVPCLSSRSRRKGEWVKTVELRAKDALEFCGIADLALEQASALSHGDLKRLELARAIATEPDLLLLDEPFGGLNPAETKLIAASLKRLHKGGRFGRLHSEGPAMLIVEHKLTELMKIVDRVIVLSFGQLIAAGTPEEIVKNPQVVKAYLGKEVKHFVS
ncbi:MAG: ABC transporter ATP-binding protein [Desulfatiglans sp.]|jgi:branched-chain amino acid transport system ATP-binding protein|nr:ABC transporter ATP-binding protein [Thermodesulfobacteriota bacterium]MEE4354158.1 ABC transporter ATP-binding protein [Desulfatiglans sp.]